ncbi:MAG: Panacea domain-containing protein [Candidatus Tisiphia sp.]
MVLVDREAGDTITQLKLQKLIYFAQGVSLALLDRPLFNEEIEAWKQEAVVRVLQKIFDNFKYVNMLYNFRTNNFACIISCKCRRSNFVYSLFSKSK